MCDMRNKCISSCISLIRLNVPIFAVKDDRIDQNAERRFHSKLTGRRKINFAKLICVICSLHWFTVYLFSFKADKAALPLPLPQLVALSEGAAAFPWSSQAIGEDIGSVHQGHGQYGSYHKSDYSLFSPS